MTLSFLNVYIHPYNVYPYNDYIHPYNDYIHSYNVYTSLLICNNNKLVV